MTYFQIFNSIVGIVFFAIGVFVIKKGSVRWGILYFLIGIGVLNGVLFGEISKSDDKQREIVELQFEVIDKIFLLPSKRLSVLTNDTILIDSEIEIKRIQKCLKNTVETLSSNSSSDWGCILKIQRKEQRDILAGISKNDNQTILRIYSRGEYGTNYGTMINNELGNIVEELIVSHTRID